MPFAVYLDLDAAGARNFDRITRIIESLNGDISTPTRLGHTHHITLGVYDKLNVAGLGSALSEISSMAVGLTFPAIGSFPSEQSVLFAAPIVTRELLDIHERYHRLARSHGDCQKYYRPGSWFPHLTLAIQLNPHDLNAATNAISSQWTPITCKADFLQVVRFNPVETLSLYPLS